jgi:hypothetical protein
MSFNLNYNNFYVFYPDMLWRVNYLGCQHTPKGANRGMCSFFSWIEGYVLIIRFEPILYRLYLESMDNWDIYSNYNEGMRSGICCPLFIHYNGSMYPQSPDLHKKNAPSWPLSLEQISDKIYTVQDHLIVNLLQGNLSIRWSRCTTCRTMQYAITSSLMDLNWAKH